MKFQQNIIILTFCLLTICFCLKGIKFRRTSANGFRVLMSRKYVEDIGDFLLSFLQSSKMDKKLKSLSNCLKNVSNTLLKLSNATNAMNDHPNILTIMSLVTKIDLIYKDAKNSKICSNITMEFKSYIDYYVNESKIAKGDYNKFFEEIINFFEDNYRKFYFQLKKASRLYLNKEAIKSGQVMGNLLRNFLKMRDFDVNFKDSFVVRNPSQFDKEAKFFKKNIAYCEFAIGEIIPDFLKFYNTTKSEDVIPNANDLIKSMSEATKVFRCMENLEKIRSQLNE